ncbi:hypothetical protein THERMOS_1053 [Bathymodiolus thermophilus thioautotrophic gill symbiont]|uniref:Uncharacterized protein n=1 Tax=Bathymodiolus thermophilus thioautotrophic gill symbiont TaxID=2360 RepID=A0A8H8XDW7_9GAMM|nr:hypothetical protein THERMOS_1053 [Bathymodiolus thermophilus thioautotrophic gill symbiont]
MAFSSYLCLMQGSLVEIRFNKITTLAKLNFVNRPHSYKDLAIF